MNDRLDRRGRDNKFYQRLWCGHIRMVDILKKGLVYGETQVYCLQCDDLKTVIGPATRFGNDSEVEPTI